MATKAKKRTSKRSPARAKASKTTRASKAKPASKAKLAMKAKAPSKVRQQARPARPVSKAVQLAKKGRTTATTAKARQMERERLLQEERALERDVENDEEPSTFPESPEYIPGVAEDSLAEELGEAAVTSATSGDQAAENIRDEELSEEEGGPFLVTPARREFAPGTDASNPPDAEPAVFPTATRQPR